ncbi:uncharacterized protein [Rutidosis leptorrhynchoides]|uniref:uncharacterized protein n=1 Tax=Rutidosis leptorrhynchoides TaxID=125765 RepID=UPI003A99CE92
MLGVEFNEALLDQEREQRKNDREKAGAALTAAIQRVKAESQEELKRLSDASLRREHEQQEIINKLQESEKERCLLVDTLRSKLEDIRQKLVGSENKVRQLEPQLFQQQQVSSIAKKKVEELEHETSRLKKELESEKAAREEAWAKVSALELQINAAMRDLEYEKRRLKAARERIMLRETQIRSFYSTTEEISRLFAKQQEQLESMQKTLEDEENYENLSVDNDINSNVDNQNPIDLLRQSKEAIGSQSSSGMKAVDQVQTSSYEASATENHDCDARNQETCEDTQEAEFTSFDPCAKGPSGSDIDGENTAAIETKQVLETKTQGLDQHIDLHKLNARDTMVMDNEEERVETDGDKIHQSKEPVEEDTKAGDTIITANLLASEVAGSWAYNATPSCHGENESPGSGGGSGGGGGGVLHNSASVAAKSQTGVVRNFEHEALTKMIGVIAPQMQGKFVGVIKSDSEKGIASNSDTGDCTEDGSGESDGVPSYNDNKVSEAMDEDDNDDDGYESIVIIYKIRETQTYGNLLPKSEKDQLFGSFLPKPTMAEYNSSKKYHG